MNWIPRLKVLSDLFIEKHFKLKIKYMKREVIRMCNSQNPKFIYMIGAENRKFREYEILYNGLFYSSEIEDWTGAINAVLLKNPTYYEKYLKYFSTVLKGFPRVFAYSPFQKRSAPINLYRNQKRYYDPLIKEFESEGDAEQVKLLRGLKKDLTAFQKAVQSLSADYRKSTKHILVGPSIFFGCLAKNFPYYTLKTAPLESKTTMVRKVLTLIDFLINSKVTSKKSNAFYLQEREQELLPYDVNKHFAKSLLYEFQEHDKVYRPQVLKWDMDTLEKTFISSRSFNDLFHEASLIFYDRKHFIRECFNHKNMFLNAK